MTVAARCTTFHTFHTTMAGASLGAEKNAAPSPTITIPLEDFIGDDVLKTFDEHEELHKDKIRRRDERSKWRR